MDNRSVSMTSSAHAVDRQIGRKSLALAVIMIASGLVLTACNTTAGVGQDVSATGAAVTRGANDIKSGL